MCCFYFLLYLLDGDAETALSQLHACLKREGVLTRKKQAEVHALLGRAYMDQRDWGSAEKHLALSCKREPNVLNTWMCFAELYSATDRDDMAMRSLQRCTELDRAAGGAWSMMAKMFEKHGQASRAMAIYENAMDPDDPSVALRRNKIRHDAALKLQRIFRGHQARKQMMKNQTRQVARNYGARAPLRGHLEGAKGGEYPQRWEIKRTLPGTAAAGGRSMYGHLPLARDGGRGGGGGVNGRKPLGSSFF